MRFINFTEELMYAICEFCEEQNNDPEYADYDILGMLDSAAEEFAKIDGVLPVTDIHHYHICGKYSRDILPAITENNGVVYDNVVHLGTFNVSVYDEDEIPGHEITCGYDVIYDVKDKTVKLLYRVEIANEIMTTLYRVEENVFEDFDVSEFIVSLSIQIAQKLRDGGEYIRKVCDLCG